MKKILVVGATGSIGRCVVAELLQQHYQVRVLSRRNAPLPEYPIVEAWVGDLTRPSSLKGVTQGVDGIIFTHGNYRHQEEVDYGGVLQVLKDLEGRQVDVVLMTSIYSTVVNEANPGSLWKRRGERLLRCSGLPYTIVRPAWFDCVRPNEQQLYLTQKPQSYQFSASDGGVARHQLAEVLVNALSTPEAKGKTFSLFARVGERTRDFQALFATAVPDKANKNWDGVYDSDNLPLSQEPSQIEKALQTLHNSSALTAGEQ